MKINESNESTISKLFMDLDIDYHKGHACLQFCICSITATFVFLILFIFAGLWWHLTAALAQNLQISDLRIFLIYFFKNYTSSLRKFSLELLLTWGYGIVLGLEPRMLVKFYCSELRIQSILLTFYYLRFTINSEFHTHSEHQPLLICVLWRSFLMFTRVPLQPVSFFQYNLVLFVIVDVCQF